MCHTIITACFISIAGICSSQTLNHDQLRKSISKTAANASGKIGVALQVLETGDTLIFHDNQHYPMQSVFKLPIAVSLLRAIEKGQFDLDHKILITKKDLPKTVSALLEKYPQGNVKVSYREILTDMVTVSDNNACDILMRELGGPEKITTDIHQLGISDLMIVGNEAQMAADWSVQYKNWCTPSAQIKLLSLLYQQKALSKANTDLLIKLMEHTFVAPKRIRGSLPPGTTVAHRSGTSSTNNEGLSPATNDVGVITLPNGKHLAIAIFLSDSHLGTEMRDKVIADIALAAYHEFSEQP